MGSAFLGTLQSAFVADGIHHHLAFFSKEVGDQDKEREHDGDEAGLDRPTALLKTKGTEGESRDEQGGQQQHDAGIAETVKGLKELHVGAPIQNFEQLYGVWRLQGQEQTMRQVNIRAAVPQDAADLARFDALAGHGITEWNWQRSAAQSGGDPVALALAAMADPHFPSGFSNAIVAEVDGVAVGGANGYLVKPDPWLSTPGDEPVFEPIRQLFELAIGDWLLDWFAVDEHWRGKGIGAQLLDRCLATANGCGAQMSLVAEDANAEALALYHSRGFVERARRPYIPFNETSKTKHWLLLSAPVA